MNVKYFVYMIGPWNMFIEGGVKWEWEWRESSASGTISSGGRERNYDERNDEERRKITNCLCGSMGLEAKIKGIRGERERGEYV